MKPQTQLIINVVLLVFTIILVTCLFTLKPTVENPNITNKIYIALGVTWLLLGVVNWYRKDDITVPPTPYY